MSAPFAIVDKLLGGPRLTTAMGATGMIRHLLEAAANEAAEAQWGVLMSYSLVKTAAEKADAIEESILNIDENGTDDAAWTIFDQYVKDIQNLETFLLDLCSLPRKGAIVLELDDVGICQGNIEVWETNRNRLHAQLQKLDKSGATTHTWEGKLDDMSMFRRMVSRLASVIPKDSNSPMLETLESLKALLVKVDGAMLPHSESVLYGIKVAWLMHGAIAEKNNTATSPDRRYHLGHADIWSRAKHLGEKIASEEDISGLGEAYEGFLEALIVRKSTPPIQHYIRLIVAWVDVKMPFLPQTKFLVESCSELVKLYSDNESSRANHLGSVTLAIKRSIEAVTLAAGLTTQPAKSRDIVETAFTEATRLLELALQKYSVHKG